MEEKEKKSPKLYFDDDIAKTSKGYEKVDDARVINKNFLKEHLSEQIKKEINNIEEPSHAIAVSSGRLQIQRPDKSPNGNNAKSPNGKEKSEEYWDMYYAEKRIHTGIVGLDDVMEGGFKEGSVNIIGGGAGSGKSIFSMQFLVEGIRKHSENGLYISFEETEDRILEDFARFNWDLKNLINQKKITSLYYSPEQVQKVLQTGGGVIRDLIESTHAKRLVLDSLTAFTMLFETELEKRKSVLKLMEAAEKWGVTTLMTSEHEADPDKHESNVVEFAVDGVVLLYNIRRGDLRERSLEIFKMRGTRHATKIFPMKITEKGIMIFPEETVF